MKEIEASRGRSRVTNDRTKIFIGSVKIDHFKIVMSKMVKGKVKAIYYLTKDSTTFLAFTAI